MTTKIKNIPAFPVSDIFSGMTLRDYFAAKVMAGLIVNNNVKALEISKAAYIVADAMLEARNGNS